MGFEAGYCNNAGNLVAVGQCAARSNTSGARNTAIGNIALRNNTTGSSNTAVGYTTMELVTTGSCNTAVGAEAALSLTTGGSNTVLGYFALSGTTTTSNHTAIGFRALQCNTTGSSNTAVGWCSAFSVTTASNTISVGCCSTTSNTTNHTRWGNAAHVCHCITGTWVNVSDCNDKTNIESLPNNLGLKFVRRLRPVTFQFDPRESYVNDCGYVWGQKDGTLVHEKKQYGFIAQEIKEIIEDLNVQFDALGYNEEQDSYRLGYEAFLAPLSKAIQELDTELAKIKQFVGYTEEGN